MSEPTEYWRKESVLYDRRHPRLVEMARIVRSLPGRTVLDVGCSTAMLKSLLGNGYDYYGCDIADVAKLPPDHFRQVDFNRSTDLSYFAGRGIRTAHVGGVLEYLDRPGTLLTAIRDLVGPGGHLVVSVINFEADRYRKAGDHHAAWIWKPRLEELRALLADTGWTIREVRPFYLESRLKTLTGRLRLSRTDPDHPSTRARAEQFIVVAEAR